MRLLALALLLVGGMVMASPIIMVSLDREGSLSSTFGQAALYAMDLDYNPFACEFKGTEGWRRTCEPSQSPCAFLVEWDIDTPEGHYAVRLPLDGKGRGYRGGDELLVEWELATTRLAALQHLMAEGAEEGCHYSAGLMERVDKARRLLREAESGDMPHRSKAGWEALSILMRAAEDAVQEVSRHRIAAHPGKPFRLGANAFHYATPEDDYAKYYLQTLNYGTVPFYLKGFEPERGNPEYERPLSEAGWLKANGAEAKGHPLIWFYPDTTPDWLRELYKAEGYAGLRREVYDHIFETVSHCKDTIRIWDVINEAHGWANCLGLSLAELRDITRAGCEAARASDPEALLVVNNCYLTAEYVADGHDVGGPAPQERLCSAYQYCQALLEEGVDFDVIGLQLYYPSRDQFEIYRLIDRFAGLGKPLHVTELAVPGSMEPDPMSPYGPDAVKGMGTWRRPWDQSLQAEWVREFYTLCYGHSSVHAISWWDFTDKGGHFFPHGGFLDAEGKPRQSFFVLKGLAEEWGLKP